MAVAVKGPAVSPNLSGVRQSALFDGVEDEVVSRLLEHCTAEHFSPSSMILRQDETPGRLLIISQGVVDLTRTIGAREIGVVLLTSGDLVLPAPSIFRQVSLLSARALSRTRCCGLRVSAVKEAMRQSSAFTANLLAITSAQWRMSVRSILDFNSRTAAQRLAAFLLHVADRQPGEAAPTLPIAKRHLAVRLAMSPETLSRTLQMVAEHGLHLRGRAILIRDRNKVEQFCGPDPYAGPDERELGVFAL